MNRSTDWTMPKKFDPNFITLLDPGVLEGHNALEILYTFFTEIRDVDGFDIPLQTHTVKNNVGSWYPARLHPHFDLAEPINRYTTWEEFDTIFAGISTASAHDLFVNQESYGQPVNFDTTVDFLHSRMSLNLSTKKAILVHSLWGKVRSSALIAGYLMKYKSKTIQEAYNMVIEDEEELDHPENLKAFLYFYRHFLDHS
ncbi:MAG: hypothetical protein SP1CHLAM54_07360 [Chlamydiia bacterium]|nr:hypothetical protein [Chlamydiia bacterium]MCH9615642.1 hypothetical protein [Chlamydiia bacterium]MCH9628955.1 hypothetical protein [Chlamydiia bacterium]